MKQRDVYITGIGAFSPGDPIPFDHIEDVLGRITDAPTKLIKRIDRMRPIMKEMLGIDYSYYALDPKTREQTETNVSMAVKSAQEAMKAANLESSQIDLIVYGGIIYDYLCPPSSVLVQDALNIPYCAEMSIHSNCTSTYKAIQVASDLIANGRYDTALVVSSQMSSTFLRAEYFNQKALTEEQAILRWFLCDGAGAMILTANKPVKTALKVVDTYLDSVGVGIAPTMRMQIGSAKWDIPDIYEHGWHHLVQDLKVVANTAPDLFGKGIHTMLDKTKLDVTKVKCFFANIPTKHLMDLAVKNLKRDFKNDDLPFYTKMSSRGYQGPPAIIIALSDFMKEESMTPGQYLVSFVTESSKWMHGGFILELC